MGRCKGHAPRPSVAPLRAARGGGGGAFGTLGTNNWIQSVPKATPFSSPRPRLLLAPEKPDPHLPLGLAPHSPRPMAPGWGTGAPQRALAAPWGAPVALFPRPPTLAAPLLLALALLAPPARGCVQCRPGHKDVPARFARLCARYRQVHGRPGCPSQPWGPESFKGFALGRVPSSSPGSGREGSQDAWVLLITSTG